MKTKRLNDIDTFMSTEQNETCLSGTDENGEPFTVWFSTVELLEWLDINHMKEQTKKYIDNI